MTVFMLPKINALKHLRNTKLTLLKHETIKTFSVTHMNVLVILHTLTENEIQKSSQFYQVKNYK